MKSLKTGMDLKWHETQLCDIQGRLFENSLKENLDSRQFIDGFMNSHSAAHLDEVYNRLQWMGEEYILEELMDTEPGLFQSEKLYSQDVMYWMGWLYRFWHFITGETSKEIVRQAGPERMKACWAGFHTLDPEMAIERLKELHEQNSTLPQHGSFSK